MNVKRFAVTFDGDKPIGILIVREDRGEVFIRISAAIQAKAHKEECK